MGAKQKAATAVRYGLGGLWILDAILQFQSMMFTRAFVDQVLAPTLQGEPSWIAAVINFGIRLWSANFVTSNLGAALIQAAIGLLLLLPLSDHAQRFGLWLSVVWGLAVWIFGEGFGTIFTGSATFYNGAPGAALIYATIAILLLYYSERIELFSRVAGLVFLLGATLNLAPMFWQPTMLSMISMGAPTAATNWLASQGAQGTMTGNIFAIGILAAIGLSLVILPKHRAVAWAALVFLAAVWWLGQGFGGIETFPFGLATDPNTAPVLALALLPALLYTKNNVRPTA